MKGVTVKDIKISILPEADGTNMRGTIVIPNPSVMTITLGDLVQDIRAVKTGKTIGNATIRGVTLRPGLNEFAMQSVADQATVITMLSTDPAANGNIDVEAITRTITYKGLNLPYFEAAMKASPVKLTLALRAPLEAIGLDLFGKGKSTTPAPVTTGKTTTSAAPVNTPAGINPPAVAATPAPAPAAPAAGPA